MELETPISFANDIAVLFTDPDVVCMDSRIHLRDYAVMSDPAGNEDFGDYATARNVLDRLSQPGGPLRMPRGRPPWPQADIDLFARWIEQGCPP